MPNHLWWEGKDPCKRKKELMPCKRHWGMAASLAKGLHPLKLKWKEPLQKGKANPKGWQSPLGKGRKPLRKGRKPLKNGRKPLRKGRKPLRKGRKPTLEEGMKDGPWYNVRKTNAKKPKRTYLTGCLQEGQGTRRILIVEVPATWSSQHEYICDEIMKSLQKDKIGKEEALQMRQVLVNNFPWPLDLWALGKG